MTELRAGVEFVQIPEKCAREYRNLMAVLAYHFGVDATVNAVSVLNQIIEQRQRLLTLVTDDNASHVGAVLRPDFGCVDGGPWPPPKRYDIPIKKE